MPTYEYRCKDCGHTFEVVQSFTDDALTECPSCGGQLRKVFGNVGITFKGSGFYKTDSRSSSANGSKSDKKTDADAGSGAKKDSSSDARPSSSKRVVVGSRRSRRRLVEGRVVGRRATSRPRRRTPATPA